MNKIIISGIEKEIEESIDKFHPIGLHIAKLNLIDYNIRFNTDFDLVYLKDNEGRFMFKLANPPQYLLEHKIDSDINFFRSWALNFEDPKWFENYYHNIANFDFNDISMWRAIDQKMYSDKRDYFITKYWKYAPLGFLSPEQEESVKSEISKRFLRFL